MQGTHDTRSANSDLAHATSLCYAVFQPARAAEPEPQLLSSLQKHAEVGGAAESHLPGGALLGGEGAARRHAGPSVSSRSSTRSRWLIRGPKRPDT